MFSKPTRSQVLALAAIFQSCSLVSRLAHTGAAEAHKMQFAMSTLLNQNPDSLQELYGSIDNLHAGMATMQAFLSNTNTAADLKEQEREVINYVMSSIHLAGKLSGDSRMLAQIKDGVENANNQAQHFSITHENVYSNIAALYQDTISKMRLKIQVSGSAVYLQQSAVAARIRCMLFSAIRSAFLWRQLGGKRRHLMLQRKTLLETFANN